MSLFMVIFVTNYQTNKMNTKSKKQEPCEYVPYITENEYFQMNNISLEDFEKFKEDFLAKL